MTLEDLARTLPHHTPGTPLATITQEVTLVLAHLDALTTHVHKQSYEIALDECAIATALATNTAALPPSAYTAEHTRFLANHLALRRERRALERTYHADRRSLLDRLHTLVLKHALLWTPTASSPNSRPSSPSTYDTGNGHAT